MNFDCAFAGGGAVKVPYLPKSSIADGGAHLAARGEMGHSVNHGVDKIEEGIARHLRENPDLNQKVAISRLFQRGHYFITIKGMLGKKMCGFVHSLVAQS